MQRILELLGFASAGDPGGAQTASVRRIVEALGALDDERARFLAAFAYLLGRVAHADLHISSGEAAKMEEIVTQHGDLPPDQARLVVDIVRAEHHERGGTQNYQVAREFRAITRREQREDLLHCLFAVSAADDVVSNVEEKHIRQIAEELGFSHREYVGVRAHYNEHRSVVQKLKGA